MWPSRDVWLESRCTCTADLWVCTEKLHNLSQELKKLFWGSRILLWASRLSPHSLLLASVYSFCPKEAPEIRGRVLRASSSSLCPPRLKAAEDPAQIPAPGLSPRAAKLGHRHGRHGVQEI